MKRVILVLMLSAAAACTPPPTIVTPQGRAAFTADQAVVRVNELMNAAIAANGATPSGLDTATTRIIVQWSVSADQILAATPNGYIAAIQASWNALQPQIKSIPPTSTVGIALAAAGAVIGGLQ
jgi:hypothetical protein